MYALDLLEKAGILGCKPATIPVKTNVDLLFDDSHTLDDPGRYRRLIEKLIHLTITRPDITFVVGILSRFMHHLRYSLVSCDKGSVFHEELSRKRVGVQKT